MYKYFISLFLCWNLSAEMVAYKITSSSQKKIQSIKILDAKELYFNNIHELSGLSYRSGKLYALSDQGILYLFKIKIKSDKITKLQLIKHYRATCKFKPNKQLNSSYNDF